MGAPLGIGPSQNYFSRPWVEASRKDFVCEIARNWSAYSVQLGLREAPLRQYDTGVEGFAKFVRDILNCKTWSKQLDIVESVLNNSQTAVISGHSVGKSFTAALLCEWWFSCRGFPFLTTGPTKRHVEKVLWKYISANRQRAKKKLPGKIFKSAKIEVSGQDWWWAEGFTTSEDEGGQGFHSPDLLIVGDEYAGLKKNSEAAIRSSMASRGCRLLAIGNPNEEKDTEFFSIWHNAEIGEEWNKIHISSLDSPNITGECEIDGLATKEWCDREKKKLLKQSPDEYRMKILGLWPKLTVEKKVLPYDWIVQAQKLWLELEEEEQDYLHPPRISKIFCDISEGTGVDKTALVYLAGQRVHIKRWWKPKGKTGLMKVAVYIAEFIRDLRHKPDSVACDSDAVGAGVTSKLEELKELNPGWFGKCQIIRFIFGGSPPEAEDENEENPRDNFKNKIAWIHWEVRRRIDPDQPRQDRWALPPVGPDGLTGAEITKQMNMRKWGKKDGKIWVQSKHELKGSPDVGDAIVGLANDEEAIEGFIV